MQPISVRGWLVLAVCALCPALAFGVLITGFSFWTGPWIEEFHITRSNAVAAYTFGASLLTLSGPLVGRAIDKVSIRLAAALGGLAMAAGMAVAALSPSFWMVLALFATAIPIGAGFFGQIAAQTLATRMFPQHTGLVNGVVVAGMAISGMLMALVVPGLIASVGWRGAFLVLAAVIAIVVVPLVWFMYDDPAGLPVKAAASPGEASPKLGGFGALGTVAFWLILASVLPINIGLAAIPAIAVDIARDAGLGMTAASLFVTVFAVAGSAGGLGGGWLCDRIGLRRVYAGICVTFLAALGLFAIQPGAVLLTVAMGLIGLAGAAIIPWWSANVAERFGPADFGKVAGLLGVFFIPSSFYPMLVAWIRDETGSYQPAFLLSAAIIALGMTTLAAMRPPARPPAEAPAAL